MRTFLTLHVGPYDRPVVEVSPADDAGPEGMTLCLTEGVTLVGDRDDVERWVRDLAAQVAMSEAAG